MGERLVEIVPVRARRPRGGRDDLGLVLQALGAAMLRMRRVGHIGQRLDAPPHALVDPTGSIDAPPLAPSPRPKSLDDAGVTLGLLDLSKRGGAPLLDALHARLLREHPTLHCKRYAKPTFSRPMPSGLASRVGAECTAVVAALAD